PPPPLFHPHPAYPHSPSVLLSISVHLRSHPVGFEGELIARTTRQAFLDGILCERDEDGTLIEQPEKIIGTWEQRGDGAWVDSVTGYVFAPNADGTWPSGFAVLREWRALRERLREEANPTPSPAE
ncbi:MAG: hypothetical protein AAFN17_10835, partial [Pseudomonadota bacterium]